MSVWHPAIQAWLRNSLRRLSAILFCFSFLSFARVAFWVGGGHEGEAPSRASGPGHFFLIRWRSNNVEVMLTVTLGDVARCFRGLIGRGGAVRKMLLYCPPHPAIHAWFSISCADKQLNYDLH